MRVSLFLGAVLMCIVAFGQTEIVLYSSGLALVTETRTVSLEKEGVLELSGFPAEVLWETLAAEGLEIVALQPLHLPKWTPLKLLGQEIAVRTGTDVFHGVLREITAEGLVLETAEDLVLVRDYEWIQGGQYEAPGKTQVSIHYRTQEPGEKDVRLRYLTRGLSYRITYDAELVEGRLRILGKAAIHNGTGVDFLTAKVTLLAGEIRVPPREPGTRVLAMPSELMPTQTFEYYRYDLPGTWKVPQGDLAITLVSMSVLAARIYRARGHGVEVHLLFTANTVLPAGEVRVYTAGIFGGTSTIAHTPVGKDVDLWVGGAFDLTEERVQIARERVEENLFRETWRIVLRSAKQEDVEVEVIEALSGYWRILHSTLPYETLDAGRVKFLVPVPKGGTTSLEYTVEWRY